MDYSFSGPVKNFHGRVLPHRARPAGYAALIDAFDLGVPVPYRLCAIGERHKVVEEGGWKIFTPRYDPEASPAGHLTFALKYEGVDLNVLNRLFERIPPAYIEETVRSAPTGSYARRVWFLYEWLTGKRLELPDADRGGYIPVLDTLQQYGIEGRRIPRQRVVNNLPGTTGFCPLVYRTPVLESFIGMDLKSKAAEVMGRVSRDVIARTASFLLLKDSKASFLIEGESPPQSRIQRWGRAIGEAGHHDLSTEELIRLQKLIIGDLRFVSPGLRSEGGFVGEHDRDTGVPLPEHISAAYRDLPDLMNGLIEFNNRCTGGLDPVIAAACMAFGFVFIHPFQDGNGRIHRYLIHHVLARSGYSPSGVIFPVSAVILKRIDEYRSVLQRHSGRLLPLINWRPTQDNNVEVLNETADYYRFFDATPHAEFLFSCVRDTIERELPAETQLLQAYDRFKQGVGSIVDMPSKDIDLMFRFLRQGKGTLSNRARTREFLELREDEIERIEEIFNEAADMYPD